MVVGAGGGEGEGGDRGAKRLRNSSPRFDSSDHWPHSPSLAGSVRLVHDDGALAWPPLRPLPPHGSDTPMLPPQFSWSRLPLRLPQRSSIHDHWLLLALAALPSDESVAHSGERVSSAQAWLLLQPLLSLLLALACPIPDGGAQSSTGTGVQSDSCC